MDGLRVENDPTNLLAQTKKENGRLIEESQEVDEEQNGEALGDGNATGNDDEAIRTYIQQHIKKFGGVSTENVRKTFAIGWIRAKRLHDQEMGLKTDEVRYASDEKLRGYIRRCFEEKGSCSVNHLRQEFSVGYNRAKKILDEEKERVECTQSAFILLQHFRLSFFYAFSIQDLVIESLTCRFCTCGRWGT
jgi:DNA segregation ATPase FtsK/SpoIIIE-like protein